MGYSEFWGLMPDGRTGMRDGRDLWHYFVTDETITTWNDGTPHSICQALKRGNHVIKQQQDKPHYRACCSECHSNYNKRQQRIAEAGTPEQQAIDKERLFGATSQHPSYGYISVSRHSGSHSESLFCSRIKNYNCVRLELGTADRGLRQGVEHCQTKKRLIAVDMTHEQFANLVAGTGTTPVTIRWLPDVGMIERPPHQSKEELFREVFEDVNKQIDETLDKAIGQAKTKKLVDLLGMAKGRLKSNFPYLMGVFQEELEKAVAEAKGQVDAHINDRLKEVGLEAVRQSMEMPELLEGPKGGEK